MDIPNGHLLALEYLFINKSTNLSINLGTGKGFTVLELIKNFEEVNNLKLITVLRKGEREMFLEL